ncbi:septal ring lytic transglycosylase RlpA family protein [Halomonas rhizosphaerae]|uniref:Endolytic peptidoglycan transglycosylase RlpA n=1 Tax=Halomonas rhizosphaerae TaxID=3043296 RepID=A0ABT6V331_9GAMM|nr:septal ring lytic transglycosylase RlpA family protein [Halomonas rhizosphaerae]MDI5892620.1 septal ring lytic transglycosylase RlpA family protein [Halomonas rhizosphaerae]
MRRTCVALSVLLLLAGCAGGDRGPRPSSGEASSEAPATSGSGERYALAGDAYPEDPPDVAEVPDAVPRREARSRGGNKSPYEVWGKRYEVMAEARGYSRQGRASWYGEKFHGYATSNGEIYDMYKMSAAHRSLPLPSFVRVTSLDNGRSAIVRVNDRGPFHSDREIDLSYAAAARLGILEQGTGRVKVEAIDVERWIADNGDASRAGETSSPREASASVASEAPRDRPVAGGGVFLQVAALGSADGARQLKSRLEGEIDRPVRVASATGLHRVQVGPLEDAGQVDPVREQLRRAGFAQAFVVDDAD